MNDEFPLEKILEVSKDDYLESVGKTNKDYDFVGVRVEGALPDNLTKNFQTYGGIPSNAEVIVDYKVHFIPADSIKRPTANAYGTALVPKQKSSYKSDFEKHQGFHD